MTNIVLLAVAAAWGAVLLPPLLRSRSDNRPGSSVSDFNRQLSSLQRSVPTRGMAPMRSMSRSLAQSPLSRPAAAGRPGQLQRVPAQVSSSREHIKTASLQRRSNPEAVPSRGGDHGHRQAHLARPITSREDLRRRRSNVLFVLVLSACSTLFLAATTHANVMMYAFALSFLSLCGYCYLLVQIKQQQQNSQYAEAGWLRAA